MIKTGFDLAMWINHHPAYATRLKVQVTIRLGGDVIEYFKALSEETGIPSKSLINLHLRDCVATNRRPDLSWHKHVASSGLVGLSPIGASSADGSPTT